MEATFEEISLIDNFIEQLRGSEPSFKYIEEEESIEVSHTIGSVTLEFRLSYSHEVEVLCEETMSEPEHVIDTFTNEDITEITLFECAGQLSPTANQLHIISCILNNFYFKD